MDEESPGKKTAINVSQARVVGLSISRCILSMAEGKIPERVVIKIIGGTHFYNIDDLWAAYGQKYWSEHILRARAIFPRLAREGRIFQPRLTGQAPPDSTSGIWMVGVVQLDTPQLIEFLEICGAFLEMTVSRREDFIEHLPTEALQKMVDDLLQVRLEGFFPEFAKVAETLSPHVIYKMIKDRLRQFFQTASEEERASVLPSLIQIMAPFFKTFPGPPSGKQPSREIPFPFTQSYARKKKI